jgi:hypothetical protein
VEGWHRHTAQALASTDEKCHTITDILTRGLPGPKRIISQVSSKIFSYRYRYQKGHSDRYKTNNNKNETKRKRKLFLGAMVAAKYDSENGTMSGL